MLFKIAINQFSLSFKAKKTTCFETSYFQTTYCVKDCEIDGIFNF